MVITQRKKSIPQGGRWTRLENPGEVRRFLKWLILSTKKGDTEVKKAGVLGQLGIYLLKAMQDSDLEQRIRDLESALEGRNHGDTGSLSLPH